jgi:hypothetical protein
MNTAIGLLIAAVIAVLFLKRYMGGVFVMGSSTWLTLKADAIVINWRTHSLEGVNAEVFGPETTPAGRACIGTEAAHSRVPLPAIVGRCQYWCQHLHSETSLTACPPVSGVIQSSTRRAHLRPYESPLPAPELSQSAKEDLALCSREATCLSASWCRSQRLMRSFIRTVRVIQHTLTQ